LKGLSDLQQGVSSFWLNAMKNNGVLAEEVSHPAESSDFCIKVTSLVGPQKLCFK